MCSRVLQRLNTRKFGFVGKNIDKKMDGGHATGRLFSNNVKSNAPMNSNLLGGEIPQVDASKCGSANLLKKVSISNRHRVL